MSQTPPPLVTPADVVAAVNEVLSRTRHVFESVAADTLVAHLDLESIDYVEIFILIEERTGAVFDLSQTPGDVKTVGDLARYRQVFGHLAE